MSEIIEICITVVLKLNGTLVKKNRKKEIGDAFPISFFYTKSTITFNIAFFLKNRLASYPKRFL